MRIGVQAKFALGPSLEAKMVFRGDCLVYRTVNCAVRLVTPKFEDRIPQTELLLQSSPLARWMDVFWYGRIVMILTS